MSALIIVTADGARHTQTHAAWGIEPGSTPPTLIDKTGRIYDHCGTEMPLGIPVYYDRASDAWMRLSRPDVLARGHAQ